MKFMYVIVGALLLGVTGIFYSKYAAFLDSNPNDKKRRVIKLGWTLGSFIFSLYYLYVGFFG